MTWDPTAHQDGEISSESGQITAGSWPTGTPLILNQVVYQFNLADTAGNGPNGAGFEVVQALAGSFASTAPNPSLYWDPTAGPLQSAYTGAQTSGYAYNPGTLPVGYSNTLDVYFYRIAARPVDYVFAGLDTYGDGWNGNYMRMQVAPIGT